MTKIDFTAPADVFWSTSARKISPRGTIRFRSFSSLEAAVRFFVDDKSEVRYRCAIDTDEDRFTAEEIEALYHSSDFPLLLRG